MRSDGEAFLGVAADIAHRIAGSAIWSGGRCNWMGAPASERSRVSGRAAVAALGPDLYEGTSGVALFLAEAAARLDEPRLRATALGASRLSLEQAGRLERDGLYAGRLGVAYAAVRVAALHGAEDVAAGAAALVKAWRRDARPAAADDVMGGRAGSLVALVALAAPDGLTTRARRRAHRAGGARAGRLVVAGSSTAVDARPLRIRARRVRRGPRRRRAVRRDRRGPLPGRRRAGVRLRALVAGPAHGHLAGPARRRASHREAGARRVGGRLVVPRRRRDRPGAPPRARAAGFPGAAPRRRLALAACERHVAGLLGRDPHDFSLCHGAAGAGDVCSRAVARSSPRRSAGWASSGTAGPARRTSRAASPVGRRRRSCRASRGSACSTSDWPIAAWRARCSWG